MSDSGEVVTKGKSADSLLVQLVAGLDPDRVMPPKGERLTAAEVGKVRAWIDQGAVVTASGVMATASTARSVHWSFQPISVSRPPRVKNRGWARNPIDAFILAPLEAAALEPSPQADKSTLARRVSLDLVGIDDLRLDRHRVLVRTVARQPELFGIVCF